MNCIDPSSCLQAWVPHVHVSLMYKLWLNPWWPWDMRAWGRNQNVESELKCPTLCLFSCTTSITCTLHSQWYDSSNSSRARRTNDQPTINVDKTEFYRRLGREYSMSHRVPLDNYWYPLAVEELEDLCFDFGIEYDGDVSYLSLIW